MKKLVYIALSALLFSCGEEKAEKPKHLLSEDEMVNILYDITLLQAISSYTPKALDDNKIDNRNYIYNKYKTDSLTFVQSNEYYASDLDVYEGIQKKVKEKIEQDKIKYGFKKKESPATTGTGPKIRARNRS
ncbi:DUF4296 domain-containing protein [Flavobacterium album]|uniref:DUF4296 domain-containing protein n=1 Tax=Flavobacterium album TaxID=2175091 RepID=A0A2S1QUQ4_9FLAO|nr:DUF4296 domain-containing protein [Flavobacterium album]AWH84059.1 DUF4296 domain-containing protein [Flavobacterium album]